MKTVYVIEDQVVLKDFIIRLLGDFPELELVGSSENGLEGCEEALKLRPELMILDVMLPGLNGAEVLRRIKKELPETIVLGFSGFQSRAVLKQMVENRADGLVRKTEGLLVLEQAIRQVISGQTYYSPEIVDLLRDMMLNPEKASSIQDLSARERQVLQLIAESNSNKEIAAKLSISIKTAETHRNNIMRKLDVHDAVALTRYAIANGLVTTDSTPS